MNRATRGLLSASGESLLPGQDFGFFTTVEHHEPDVFCPDRVTVSCALLQALRYRFLQPVPRLDNLDLDDGLDLVPLHRQVNPTSTGRIRPFRSPAPVGNTLQKSHQQKMRKRFDILHFGRPDQRQLEVTLRDIYEVTRLPLRQCHWFL